MRAGEAHHARGDHRRSRLGRGLQRQRDQGDAAASSPSIAARRFELELIGRKGRDFFRRRRPNISGEHTGLFIRAVNFEDALEIARQSIDRFINDEIDAVYLVVQRIQERRCRRR